MAYQYVILKEEQGVATVTINRPERLNAIGGPVIKDIVDALDEVRASDTARVCVVTGAGRAFCAGGDFKGGPGTPGAIATSTTKTATSLGREVRTYTKGITWALQNLEVPTIAMVNGAAAGAGFDIALACDMRIGCENSRFRVAWTERGLTTAFGTTWFLPRIIGVGRAAELIYTARMVEAQEALQLGILNRLVPAAQLERETMDLARQLAKGPPLALRSSKYNIYKGLEVDLDTALGMLASAQAQLLMSKDFEESSKAFLEKRAPVFQGK